MLAKAAALDNEREKAGISGVHFMAYPSSLKIASRTNPRDGFEHDCGITCVCTREGHENAKVIQQVRERSRK